MAFSSSTAIRPPLFRPSELLSHPWLSVARQGGVGRGGMYWVLTQVSHPGVFDSSTAPTTVCPRVAPSEISYKSNPSLQGPPTEAGGTWASPG